MINEYELSVGFYDSDNIWVLSKIGIMKGAILLFLVIVLAYVCASPSPESDAAKRNRPQGMLS